MNTSASSEYLATYGLSGELGRFRGPVGLLRGERAVLHTPRGVEVGEVLRPVSPRLAGMLADQPIGELLRAVTTDDVAQLRRLSALSEDLLRRASKISGAVVLDAEILFDQQHAVLHIGESTPRAPLRTIAAEMGLELSLWSRETDEEEGGCGSCSSGGGGCSTGACGTCGTINADDARLYFSSLRDQMETTRRVPLL